MLKIRKKIFAGVLLISLVALLVGGIASRQVEAQWPALRTGQKTVTAKGTPEQLPALDLRNKDVHLVVKAMNANTGALYLGYSSATALNTNSDYYSLYPGESVELKISNANLVWLDAESGEGIEYIVEYD